MFKFSLRVQLDTTKVDLKAQKASEARVMLAGLAIEREAKTSLTNGGGRAGPPQIREVQYFYGDPKNSWVRSSKAGAPPNVQTGDLRNSIKTEKAGFLTVVVGPSLFYGKFLEFGTRVMAARPFMRPALQKMKTKMPQLFRRLW